MDKQISLMLYIHVSKFNFCQNITYLFDKLHDKKNYNIKTNTNKLITN